jgi:NitT/TauT family transport system substrate-binding protein
MTRARGILNLRSLAVAMVVLLAAPAAAWAAPKKVQFVLDFLPDGLHAPFYAALEKGFYAKEDLDVTISRGYGSGDTVRKLAVGQFDLGLAHLTALVTARANEDAPVKGVMAYVTRDMLAIWYRDEEAIKTPKDLAGKTIATTPGNAHFVIFPAFAKAAGFDPSTVRWVTVDATLMGPMLINKQVDAAPFFASHGPRLRPQAAERNVKLSLFPYADSGLTLYSTAIIARDETIKKDPDMIARFVRATLAGMRWAADNPDETARFVLKHHPEATMEATLGSWEVARDFIFSDEAKTDGQGVFERGRLAKSIEVLHSGMSYKRVPSPDDVATNQFVPR